MSKITDQEIEKSIECCTTFVGLCLCSQCPLKGMFHSISDCRTSLLLLCANYINNLKEKNK